MHSVFHIHEHLYKNWYGIFFLESSIGFRSLKSNKLQTDSTPPHTLELNPLSNHGAYVSGTTCLFYGGRSI